MSPWSRLLAGPDVEVDDARWVVVDVESSGLDPTHDRLLAIAAVALQRDGERLWIVPGDSFEVVLAPVAGDSARDEPKVPAHGIGAGAPRAGADPAVALRGFEAWAGRSPRLGYHAAFDRRMIERATEAVLGDVAPRAWLELAQVAPLLHPQVAAKTLDDWLDHFGIRCTARHQAAADALATAELLLRLWPALCREGATSFAAIARLAARRRWLG